MAIEVRSYCNSDEAAIVWRASSRIPGCRGFALRRQAVTSAGESVEDMLDTYVGFAGGPKVASGTHKSSTVWPIQRFIWRDYGVAGLSSVRYQVVPMLGSAADLAPAPDSQCSGWSQWSIVGTGHTLGYEAYFNRGIVAAQWLTRRLAVSSTEAHRKLAEVIADPTSPIRAFLGGQDRVALLKLLADAKAAGSVVYLSLYELNDVELVPALTALGAKANLILASGAFGPGQPDENAAIRQQLKQTSQVRVFDRLVTGSHFAHNKFAVVCDPNGLPRKVWTGSTNWTETGLCTQANNALLITDTGLASGFLSYWHRLLAAGSGYPASLATADQTPLKAAIGATAVTAWTTPVREGIDLADARARIQAATQGVLFLMFIPGRSGTLLNDILALNDRKLFVHGVVNQDPGGSKNPIIKIVQRGHVLDANPDVILPAAISTPLSYWQPELKQYSTAMIHSKVVVVDPFGDHPVVITGSHNLGPKASGKNDDNMVIVEDAPGLAAEYAVNVLGIYDQYKWRYNMLARSKSVATPASMGAGAAAAAIGGAATAATGSVGGRRTSTWSGLQDNDTWQDEFFGEEKQRELHFWFGESPAVAEVPTDASRTLTLA
jgi:phosphatidylserine/phosphatidylglycerophosphate/cardiolipin synthase-like enzyme